MTNERREIRIVVIEDHAVTRLGIVAILAQRPDLRVVAEASSLAAARVVLDTHRPDVAVLDVRLSDGSGLDLLRERRAMGDTTRFVVLTMFGGPDVANEARAAGADAFVDKAIDASAVLEAVRHASSSAPVRGAMRMRTASRTDVPLSPREVEVLRLIAAGLTNGEIAQRLAIGWTTVRTHVVHVLDKLGARDRTEAAAIAVRRGIVDPLRFDDEP